MKCRNSKATLLSVFLLLVCSTAARADDVWVDCSGASQPPVYNSINSALGALSPTGQHTITVTGTCAENVQITSLDRVTLQGAEGQTTTINPEAGDGVVVSDARGITLQHLVIKTPSGTGIWMRDNSHVRGDDAIIENNDRGILVEGRSTLTLSDSIVRNNRGYGIHVRDSMVSISGGVTVENNAGTGIRLTGSQANIDGAQHPNVVQGSGYGGIMVAYGSSAKFVGDNLIQDNTGIGLQVSFGSHARMFGATVQRNTLAGVLLGVSSGITAHEFKVLNNGSTSAGWWRGAGIFVSESSSLYLGWGADEIRDNMGPGIYAYSGASVDVGGSGRITGNGAEGIVLLGLSVGYVDPEAAWGNAGPAFACDSTSGLFAWINGIYSPMKCEKPK